MDFIAKVFGFTKVVLRPSELKSDINRSSIGKGLPIVLGLLLVAAVGLTGCAGKVSTANSAVETELAPVVFVPGRGMSALNVQVLSDKDVTDFDFLLPSMNPIDILPQGAKSALDYSVTNGLPREEAALVPTWMSLLIDDDGVASNQPGVSVAPVSLGRDFAAECPRYLAMTNQLAAAGWTLDANLFCLPFDYRYARGQFLRFGLHDPRGTCGVGGKWPKGGGGLPQPGVPIGLPRTSSDRPSVGSGQCFGALRIRGPVLRVQRLSSVGLSAGLELEL